ncbi:MAG TPA: hypothetical protein VKI18_08815 [Albitalea sp.]|nr:hypothetical protein [Albitalea sp.]
MAEARTTSLLDFAIAASVAVVPIMFCIVLLVAVVRPVEQQTAVPRGDAERYVSVRHVAALKTFERAVVWRTKSAPALPGPAEVLAAVPQCRADWQVKAVPLQWLHDKAAALPWLQTLIDHGRTAAPSQAERIAAQLAALDAALLRFGSRANARVEHAVGFDAQRWFEAANTSLGHPIEVPEYPGQHFQVRCADLAAALASLSRADARMLEVLAWRGTETAKTVARWKPDQVMEIAPRQVARRNPWNGLAGCIYLGGHDGVAPSHFVAAARSSEARLCAMQEMFASAAASAASQARPAVPVALAGEPTPTLAVDDPAWMVPPSLDAMLRPLETLRRPTGSLYRLYTEAQPASAAQPSGYRYGPNRIALDGAPVDVGFSVDLTINPSLQALAQKTAACYTGRQDLCRALGIQRADDKGQAIGHKLLESAMVRMAAVAVIDVASGRIEALAGALSPCTRQEFDGPGRDAACDKRLPYPVRYRPDALLNPAVFHDAMPASTIKPIMATAFLTDREVGARWLAAEQAAIKSGAAPAGDSLRSQLMRSDSARFLDRMFCADKNFMNCERPWAIQATAQAFGWNTDCADAHLDCGKHDLLFGRAIDTSAEAGAVRPLALAIPYGRLLSEPLGGKLGAPMHFTPRSVLNPGIVARCAAGADGRRRSDDDWEKCRGGNVVDVVAEGWGQGHARSSALGIAGMMATLAAAANGQDEIRRPHLVEAMHGTGARLESAVDRWGLAAAQPNRLPRAAAEVILDGLSYSHRSGTARTACEQVFDAKTCKGIGFIAGKTGTPSFPSDGVSLNELARRCGPHAAKTKVPDPACGSLRPYKWYVATFRGDAGKTGPWTKVIGVLTERNWVRASGQVHGAGDHGPNPSAEIAMQIMGRQVGVIAGVQP